MMGELMRNIPAFEMRNGRAVRCDNSGRERRIIHMTAMGFGDPRPSAIAGAVVQGLLWPLLSEDERIPRLGIPFPEMHIERQIGHAFVHASDPDRTVAVLYLPESHGVLAAHCDAICEAMQARGT